MIKLARLTRAIHFPKIQAIPDPKVQGIWRKIKKFLFYRRKWRVTEDHAIWSPSLQEWIFLPKGFIYDGASVPKLFHSILGPTGILLLGSGPHDQGYRYHGLIFFRLHAKCKGLIGGVGLTGDLVFKDFGKLKLDMMFRSLCSRESSLGIVSTVAALIVLIFGCIFWFQERKTLSGIDAFRRDFPTYCIYPSDSYKNGGEK